MTTSTTLEKLFSGSKKTELLEALTSAEMQTVAFGDFLKMLEEKKAELYIEAFRTISVADIVKTVSGAGSRASTPKVEVPAIEAFKDEAVRTAWKAKALELLETTQMGAARGLSPQKIREAMGTGNEQQGRELLTEMVAAGQIVSTGDTKGKKFVVARLKDQAEKVHLEEVAKAKAVLAKKEADKVEAAKVEAAKTAEVKPAAKPAKTK